jgi:hypothetical protein
LPVHLSIPTPFPYCRQRDGPHTHTFPTKNPLDFQLKIELVPASYSGQTGAWHVDNKFTLSATLYRADDAVIAPSPLQLESASLDTQGLVCSRIYEDD